MSNGQIGRGDVPVSGRCFDCYRLPRQAMFADMQASSGICEIL